MPKQKTHSGAKKRFKVTGSGKITHEQANRRHLMEGKSSRRTRRLMADETVKLMLRKNLPVLGSKVLVLGLTFKENCPDVRNTKVVDIVKALQNYNTQVDVYDPWIDITEAHHEYGLQCLAQAPAPGQYAAIVLAVGHHQFLAMGEEGLKAWGQPGAVLYDVKSILPLGAAYPVVNDRKINTVKLGLVGDVDGRNVAAGGLRDRQRPRVGTFCAAPFAGERDGQVLAKLRNARIRASEDEIAKSLQGTWRVEHLFALKQALDAFDFCGTQLAECDAQVQAQLQALHVREDEPTKGKKRGRARNAPKFDLRTQLFQMCGVDLTRIDGVDVTTALVVVSEVGADMGKFPSDKHFASWLGLCPGTKITGGKVMSGKTKRCANRAAQALRLAAAALRSSQSALGAYYRRMCARMDKPKAVTAAAHKLARLIYAMLTHGQEYTDRGQDYFEERYRQRVLHNLAQRAKAMGMQLVPSDNPA